MIEYVNDINATNALVLEIKEEDSTVQNVYAGSKPILEIDNGELQVLITDHKNSVIGEVTNSSLTINEYEASGTNFESNLIKSDEKVNRLGYNGEVEDSYNLQYLSARYYKQDSSRFISEDTYRGQVGSPLSHHLYTYTENDPVNNTDPSGHAIEDDYGGKWYNVTYKGFVYTRLANNKKFVFNGKTYKTKKQVTKAIDEQISKNNELRESSEKSENPNKAVSKALSDKGWFDPDDVFSRICQNFISEGYITESQILRIISYSTSVEEALMRVRQEVQKNQQNSISSTKETSGKKGTLGSGIVDGLKQWGKDLEPLLSFIALYPMECIAALAAAAQVASVIGPLLATPVGAIIGVVVSVGLSIWQVIQTVEKFNSISDDYSTAYKVGFIAVDIILCILSVASVVSAISNVAKAMSGTASLVDDAASAANIAGNTDDVSLTFRAMSKAEYDDLMKTGSFNPFDDATTLEGKWFGMNEIETAEFLKQYP